MSLAVDALSEQSGALFVIAAGNAGPETISTPGAAASALTVGAVDKQDNLASFSSTGPLTGTGALKPDLVAPGVDITAARSQDMTDGGSGLYRTISGTSMATPHVSGAAAILAQQHPGWTGQQLKEQLMSSALGPAGLVLALRGRHRSPRRGGRGDEHRAQHRLRAPRQLRLAARAERRRRDQGHHVHQRRSPGRHPGPGRGRQRRTGVRPRRVDDHRARGRQGGRSRHR